MGKSDGVNWEDPYLNSQFAKAFVRGFQGADLEKDPYRVAACVKHFALNGAPEGGRDYNTVDMSERQLREYYLPAYKAALDGAPKWSWLRLTRLMAFLQRETNRLCVGYFGRSGILME